MHLNHIEKIAELVSNKKVAILGFGKEGQSSYNFFRNTFPKMHLAIFDKNADVISNNLPSNCVQTEAFSGTGYLKNLHRYNFVIKSPGISKKELIKALYKGQISSQTDIFLACFKQQTIGITGTKGKSTTTSLLVHILKHSHRDCIITGNIGVPAFDIMQHISEGTTVLFEMSSHQLEHLQHAPHIAVLLNIFQEHLDYYDSYKDYQDAKLNIGRFQNKDDHFIFNADNELLLERISVSDFKSNILPYSLKKSLAKGCHIKDNFFECLLNEDKPIIFPKHIKTSLMGSHNLSNIQSVLLVCSLLNIPTEKILDGILTFSGLPHRMEYVGCVNGKHFYNDSIATIPEATIEAVTSIKNTDTIIIGGFDRGIDYSNLISFLEKSKIRHIVLYGEAGLRIFNNFSDKKTNRTRHFNNFDEAVYEAISLTGQEKACLLSPAAASYGIFKDFSERGNRFKTLVLEQFGDK